MKKGIDHSFRSQESKEYLQALHDEDELPHTDHLRPWPQDGHEVHNQPPPCLLRCRCRHREIWNNKTNKTVLKQAHRSAGKESVMDEQPISIISLNRKQKIEIGWIMISSKKSYIYKMIEIDEYLRCCSGMVSGSSFCFLANAASAIQSNSWITNKSNSKLGIYIETIKESYRLKIVKKLNLMIKIIW